MFPWFNVSFKAVFENPFFLLASCRSIKVKRIFLFLAAHFDYPWAKRLKTDGPDLGRGNRQVVKGGRLDKRFLITVPARFSADAY